LPLYNVHFEITRLIVHSNYSKLFSSDILLFHLQFVKEAKAGNAFTSYMLNGKRCSLEQKKIKKRKKK